MPGPVFGFSEQSALTQHCWQMVLPGQSLGLSAGQPHVPALQVRPPAQSVSSQQINTDWHVPRQNRWPSGQDGGGGEPGEGDEPGGGGGGGDFFLCFFLCLATVSLRPCSPRALPTIAATTPRRDRVKLSSRERLSKRMGSMEPSPGVA